MINLIKKNYIIICLSFLIGLATLLPQLVSIHEMDSDFMGIYPITTADDLYYLARAQDIVDGHTFLSNPYLYEHKDGSPMQFWLPDYLMAKPLSFFGIPPYKGYLIYDFFFPIILAFLTYAIFYALSRNKVISISSVLFLNVALFFDLFNRGPSPQLNFIPWLVLAFSLVKLIQTKKNKYVIFSTLSFGFLFHLYPYFWTFFLCLLGIYLVLVFLKYKFNFEYRKYFYIIFGGLIIGIPYFISLFHSMRSVYYKESIYRLGMIDTHFPSGSKIVFFSIILVVAFILALRFKVIKINYLSIFLLSGVLASAVCVNQHIITGKNLEFSSHYWLPSVFWLWFTGVYIFNKLIQKEYFRKYNKAIIFSLAIIIFVFSFFSVKAKILHEAKPADYEIEWQQNALLLNWIRDNTKREDVIFADKELSELIPIYTSANVFYVKAANLHFISDQEVKERFVINNYFNDIDDDFIQENLRDIWGVHYIDEQAHKRSKNKILKIFKKDKALGPLIPDEEYESFIGLRDELLKKDFVDLIKDYRVDYLISDNEYFKKHDQFEKVFESNGKVIYKVKKDE